MSDLNSENLETLLENFQDEDECFFDLDEGGIDLSLLRLHSFGSIRPCECSVSPQLYPIGERSPPRQVCSPGNLARSPPPPYSSSVAVVDASNSPAKRPSPEQNDVDEPRPKKPSLRREDSGSLLSGYSKIQIPIHLSHDPTRTPSSPVFKRSLSDTYASPVKSSPGSGNISYETRPLGSPSPCSTLKGNGGSSSSLPPRPPAVLRRSASDPVTSSPAKTLRRSASSSATIGAEEIPKTDEMLKIINEGAIKINRWFERLLQHVEVAGVEGQNDASKVTEEAAEEPRQECKEGVSVERVGEAFVLKFNCPCGKTYRILSSGRDCYYKLL